VGVAAGYGIVLALGQFYPEFTLLPPPWAVAGAVVLAVGCGMVFGILPAQRASRLDPVTALARR
jgi:putative ABC transport system permease protein